MIMNYMSATYKLLIITYGINISKSVSLTPVVNSEIIYHPNRNSCYFHFSKIKSASASVVQF